jgi:hypothetical protein
LSPTYRGLLGQLDEAGFEVASARREKDGLMQILTAMRRRRFPDFRDPFERGRPV